MQGCKVVVNMLRVWPSGECVWWRSIMQPVNSKALFVGCIAVKR
jgi:hypothetical protein